jgi:hypothetical protein
VKIEIRKTKEDGIIQITTLDERWYEKNGQFNPSVTWIAHYAPMGIGLLKHYANHGWDEAETIKRDAAERGSKVHQACESLLLGNTVKLSDGFINPESGEQEELTPDEYWCVMTFAAFWTEFTGQHKVSIVDTEKVAWVDPAKGEQYGYAGTRDIKLIVDGKPSILDLKTSQDVYLSHELQLSALKHADPELPDIFVLQVGYRRNKNGWKLTPIEDKFGLFLSAQKFWADANRETKPKQKDYPPELKLLQPVDSIPNSPKSEKPTAPVDTKRKTKRKPAKGTKSRSKTNKT